MRFRRSPTLSLVTQIEQARARGEQAWSLSTPTFPEPRSLPDVDASWVRLTAPKGDPALREASRAAFFGRWDLPKHEVIITAGAKAALFSVLRAALAPGSYVMVPTPCWPSYFDVCAAAGLNATPFDTHLEKGFALNVERLAQEAASCGARAFMIATPCNPTGRILPRAELAALAEMCRDQGMLLILDQSFSGIVFDADAWRDAVVPGFDGLVLVDSFSKNYMLQGARVAAAAVPARLADPFVTVHQTVASAAPTPAQKLALHALQTGDAMPLPTAQRAMAAEFIARMGWRCVDQSGTFYFFPEVPDIDGFRRRARAHNVFMLSGEAFGARHSRHIRFCFCKPEAELARILELLSEAESADAPVRG